MLWECCTQNLWKGRRFTGLCVVVEGLVGCEMVDTKVHIPVEDFLFLLVVSLHFYVEKGIILQREVAGLLRNGGGGMDEAEEEKREELETVRRRWKSKKVDFAFLLNAVTMSYPSLLRESRRAVGECRLLTG